MKKLKKVKMFPSYMSLLIKYNTLYNKHQTLLETIKSDLYKEIINGAYKKAEDLEYYKKENAKLKQKLKDLKSKNN